MTLGSGPFSLIRQTLGHLGSSCGQRGIDRDLCAV